MRKITLALAVVFGLGLMSEAKAQTFEEGSNVVNLTVGFGSGFYNGNGYSSSPGVAVSFEHGFWDNLINGDFSVGIGAYLGFATAKYVNPGTNYGWKYTTIAPAARGTFHWTYVENLDLYAGVNVGFDIRSSTEYGDWPGGTVTSSSASGGLYASPFVGARYYFTDSFAAVAEAGSGISYFNIGVGFKF